MLGTWLGVVLHEILGELVQTVNERPPGVRLLRYQKDRTSNPLDEHLVPLESDAPLVSWAAYSFFPPLLSAGVRIWRYAPAVLHAKTTAVDGSLSLVGSANLDVRSFLLNFELGVLVRDPDFASALEARFLADIAVSEEVTLKWWYAHGPLWRLLTNVSRLLSPIL